MSGQSFETENLTIENAWAQIKEKLNNIEYDVAKNARGIVAPGARVRSVLREVRNDLATLVKLTLKHEKEKKAERAANRKAS